MDLRGEYSNLVVLDPKVPWLQLPRTMCKKLAEDFQLDYIDYGDGPLFYVSNATMERLRRLRPSFNFKVGYDGMPSMDITIPYEAFEHDFTTPDRNGQFEDRPYFPIRIFADYAKPYGPGDIVLGRVFLQEA